MKCHNCYRDYPACGCRPSEFAAAATDAAMPNARERGRDAMSTVNAPLPRPGTHYSESVQKSAHGLCGLAVLANNWTSVPDDVTCLDCMLRILATLQQQQNLLIQNIAKALAATSKIST